MAALWIVLIVLAAVTLALWALLEGMNERLRRIEARLDELARRLGERPPEG